MKAIVTVVGKDAVGIIAGVCVELAKYNINVLDISQTVMQGYFTMMMAVDTSKSEIPFAELAKKLEAKGYIVRKRSRKDERNLLLSVTEEGMALKPYAMQITEEIESNTMLPGEDTDALFTLLSKILERMDGDKRG